MTRRPPAGLTMVEFLIVVLLVLSGSALALTIYFNMSRGLTIMSLKSLVTARFRSAVEQVERDLHAARTVVASRTIGATLYTTDDDTLILELPAVNSAGASVGNDYVVYQRNTTDSTLLDRIIQAVAGSTREVQCGGTGAGCTLTRVLAGLDVGLDVTGLVFDDPDAGGAAPTPGSARIVMDLTMFGQIEGYGHTKRLSVTYKLRN